MSEEEVNPFDPFDPFDPAMCHIFKLNERDRRAVDTFNNMFMFCFMLCFNNMF